MKVLEDELVNFLGNDLSGLGGKLYLTSLEKLRRYDKYTTENFYLPVIDYLLLAHQRGNRSMNELGKEVGISMTTLIRIFDYLGLPILTASERRWDKEKVIKKLREEASELGHSPVEIDVESGLYHAAISVFGSWNKAKEAAGLPVYPKAERGVYITTLKGKPTFTSRIRNYLNNNPSTRHAIIRGLQLTEQSMSNMRVQGIGHVGPLGKQIYYLKGQEHLLPLEYQNNSSPTP